MERIDFCVDQRRFRDALGQFPTGVVIVSAVSPTGDWLGMTVSSFNSVSLEPPLVMFSIARRALSFDTWRAVRHFAISVLSDEQEELSNRFARSKSKKWRGLNPIITPLSLPVLPGSLVAFECETYSRCDGGDHEIILGRVVGLHWGTAFSGQPLVVAKSKYHRLAAASADAPLGEAALLYGW